MTNDDPFSKLTLKKTTVTERLGQETTIIIWCPEHPGQRVGRSSYDDLSNQGVKHENYFLNDNSTDLAHEISLTVV